MENIDDKLKISEILLSVIYKFVERDKKAKYFGTDTALYHSEIHMIEFIKENKDLHISAIARKLDITRGAVSQTIKRLEKKGFIVKEMDEDNNSKLLIKLTEKGEIANYNHKKYHKSFDKIILDILKNEEEHNVEFLKHFFYKLEELI
ncbi:putative HTH-type transcriptional regulator [Clostridium acetireducens DSM 10703]|uniref:Putative HTH-type transcriptional regulator n=1 Tax=Clostridium acetireducens DSM 10703 TaxID=1121290 RepID=A0A1E8F102_9CLOT|nr:MarR family transcriptional regulator [Clostridium acetireducens]OFI07110.1 putative HTH-type transcriptional regulator [Clostridium acetireducens DSM 10703]